MLPKLSFSAWLSHAIPFVNYSLLEMVISAHRLNSKVNFYL